MLLQSTRMRWAGNVAHMGEHACKSQHRPHGTFLFSWSWGGSSTKRGCLLTLAYCYMLGCLGDMTSVPCHATMQTTRNNADYTIVAYATMHIWRFETIKNRCNLTRGWLVTNWSLDLSLVRCNGSQCKQNFIIIFILLKLLTVKCTIRVS
jgi:hypothetical protein